MIELDHVRKQWGEVVGLDDVSLRVEPGEFVCVQGPSGGGKTTLLLTIGGMMRPTNGRVRLEGCDLYDLGGGARAALRGRLLGFVFQMYHLIPYLSVRENIRMGGGDEARAAMWMEKFGLSPRATHRPSRLSAGEQQRTALARALIHDPKLVLCDEPTGNLDPENAAAVFRILDEYRSGGGTVIVATHGALAEKHATRTVRLRGGRMA